MGSDGTTSSGSTSSLSTASLTSPNEHHHTLQPHQYHHDQQHQLNLHEPLVEQAQHPQPLPGTSNLTGAPSQPAAQNGPKPRGRRKKIRTEHIRPICPQCDKHFSNQSALTKHKLTHSDERKFACQQCSKAFKRHDHLTGHMQTHSNRKQFNCTIDGCDKKYCDARSLRRHKENIHNISSTYNQPASATPTPTPNETGLWTPQPIGHNKHHQHQQPFSAGPSVSTSQTHFPFDFDTIHSNMTATETHVPQATTGPQITPSNANGTVNPGYITPTTVTQYPLTPASSGYGPVNLDRSTSLTQLGPQTTSPTFDHQSHNNHQQQVTTHQIHHQNHDQLNHAPQQPHRSTSLTLLGPPAGTPNYEAPQVHQQSQQQQLHQQQSQQQPTPLYQRRIQRLPSDRAAFYDDGMQIQLNPVKLEPPQQPLYQGHAQQPQQHYYSSPSMVMPTDQINEFDHSPYHQNVTHHQQSHHQHPYGHSYYHPATAMPTPIDHASRAPQGHRHQPPFTAGPSVSIGQTHFPFEQVAGNLKQEPQDQLYHNQDQQQQPQQQTSHQHPQQPQSQYYPTSIVSPEQHNEFSHSPYPNSGHQHHHFQNLVDTSGQY